MRYPLPNDTANLRLDRHHNLGLALDKYLQINDSVDESIGSPADQESWKITAETKQRKRIPNLTHVSRLIKAAKERADALLAGLQLSGHYVKQFSAVTDYRLVVGFGAEHVLETSICLHRIYGFPIIPGSSVKGVTRARAFWDIAEQLKLQTVSSEEAKRREQQKEETPLQKLDELLAAGDKKEREKLLEGLKRIRGKADEWCSNEARVLDLDRWLAIGHDFYQTFGTTERQGRVTFFDAYPTRVPQLEPDILNPHYGEYYGDRLPYRKPPADYYNPVPTFFLTVAKGSEFRFAIVGKEQDVVDKAEDWLCRALQELGIGGKTTAGYGFMREL